MFVKPLNETELLHEMQQNRFMKLNAVHTVGFILMLRKLKKNKLKTPANCMQSWDIKTDAKSM